MQKDDDWEYEETEETPEEETEPSLKYEIMNYPADTTLQGYVEMWDRKELEIPDFQRKYVWDQVRASKLIESFLLGLPIPGVFLFKPREKPVYLIIDGQQRINSIIAFIKGEFKERVFRLKNVSEQWNGKRFIELSEEEQFRLKGNVLRSTIIQQINPNDNSSIYQIFERLNTGGLNLSLMEIRQCISFGPFIEHLKHLNENEYWRKILGKNQPDNRLRDVELILRCLALQKKFSEYDKPMKGFLNDYAEEQRQENTNYEESESRFSVICASIIDQLGEKPFHFRGKINYGLLDAFLSSLLIFGPKDNLKIIFDNLVKNDNFIDSITRNTSDVQQVKNRIGLVHKALSDE